jgi:Helix-turn-helix of DDE superfamily endonuclease
MLSSHDLKPNPRVLRAFTSLDPEEFEMLLIPFEKVWQDDINRHSIHKKTRTRRYGGGRKPHLVAIEDKLLFILFYFKVYPLQAVIARIFGMSQGRANEWLDKLTPILESAVGEAPCLPEREPQNLEQVLALCVAVDFMIDGTERPIHRPTAPIEQKDQYSGKKKGIRGKTIALVMWKIISCALSVRPIPDVSMTSIFVMQKSQGFPPILVCSKRQGFKDTTQRVSTYINRRKNPKGKS